MTIENCNTESNPAASRYEQLDYLSRLLIDGEPILIHGSIGHAAMIGASLPSDIRHNGTMRDIDIYNASLDKWELESELLDLGLSQPQPIDAGMASIIVRDGPDFFASLDGITTELKDTAVLEEIAEYELKDSDGVVVKSFTPEGMLAAHLMKPGSFRPGHLKADRQLKEWFDTNGVKISGELSSSIDDFHRAHKEAYPKKLILDSMSQLYVHMLPESVRAHFRKFTHKFMLKHTGRNTPYA